MRTSSFLRTLRASSATLATLLALALAVPAPPAAASAEGPLPACEASLPALALALAALPPEPAPEAAAAAMLDATGGACALDASTLPDEPEARLRALVERIAERSGAAAPGDDPLPALQGALADLAAAPGVCVGAGVGWVDAEVYVNGAPAFSVSQLGAADWIGTTDTPVYLETRETAIGFVIVGNVGFLKLAGVVVPIPHPAWLDVQCEPVVICISDEICFVIGLVSCYASGVVDALAAPLVQVVVSGSFVNPACGSPVETRAAPGLAEAPTGRR